MTRHLHAMPRAALLALYQNGTREESAAAAQELRRRAQARRAPYRYTTAGSRAGWIDYRALAAGDR